MKRKLTKIPFNNSEFKNKYVYSLGVTVTDKTGQVFDLYQQDKVQYHVDIPLNNPNVGVIIDGIFWASGTFERLHTDEQGFRDLIGRHDLRAMAKELLEKYSTQKAA